MEAVTERAEVMGDCGNPVCCRRAAPTAGVGSLAGFASSEEALLFCRPACAAAAQSFAELLGTEADAERRFAAFQLKLSSTATARLAFK